MKSSPEIAILGFGREGKSVLGFFRKVHPKLKIRILDQKLDKNYLKNLKDFKVIYRSPGVPYNLPEIQNALRAGVKFSSATDLFFKNAKGKIIGVTGTKGKGTTSTLIYKILKAAHKDAYLAGNIGNATLAILRRLKKKSLTVLELSSFQLQDLKESPHFAVVLEVFPDHLDAHESLKEYLNAKAQIVKHQNKKDKVFYFSDNKYSKAIVRQSRGKKIPVSPTVSNSRLRSSYGGQARAVSSEALGEGWKWWNKIGGMIKIPGSHNLKNAVVAATVASYLGVPEKVILRTISNYRGLPYRLQLIKTWRDRKIYNDSASTNPQTTVAAIKSFPQPKIVIMGGYDKNLDYKPVAQALKNSTTKLVILFGANKMKIRKAISKIAKTKLAKDLKSALDTALKASKKDNIIIFSPGAASFDMFRDYKDRGKKFNELVEKLRS